MTPRLRAPVLVGSVTVLAALSTAAVLAFPESDLASPALDRPAPAGFREVRRESY